MEQRPTGVVLFAIALGLTALVFLFLGLFGLLSVVVGQHPPPGASGFVASPGALAFASLLYLGLAAWALATLRGLLRMRPWARVSSLVIAACMAGFGLLFAIGVTGAESLVASGSVRIPPDVNPAMLHKAFVLFGTFSLFVAVFGVAWLLYFARRSTRKAFVRGPARQPGQIPHDAQDGYAVPPDPRRRIPPAPAFDPLTDFTVARPIVKPPEAASTSEIRTEMPPAGSSSEDEPHAS